MTKTTEIRIPFCLHGLTTPTYYIIFPRGGKGSGTLVAVVE
jgi:hypothetical protein